MEMSEVSNKKFAAQVRLETIKEVGKRGFGHIGGALSATDLIAVLYNDVMNYDPKDPNKVDRDKLVMSKGHAGPAVYAALALKGFFPIEWLDTLNQPGTHLPSHCDKNLTPGIDMTTGSLGQGVSTSIGLALAQKLDGLDSYTYLCTGDGELDEGQCWEGALFAPSQNLDNLIWFVDYNKRQLDGATEDIIDLLNVAAKFESFGWHAQSIDGGDVDAIKAAIEVAKSVKGKPSAIVLNTTKGAGVKYVEDIFMNHHIPLVDEGLAEAIAQCEAGLAAIEA
ncbi:MAG: transketolase [Clostridiales Family XIII bacterium]|jgi:transketolase|nr:transketolase [Clostridiales Family XIII bacterium]